MDYSRVWESMNDLEMVTSKICSAREILDSAIESHENKNYEKTETLLNAIDEFLVYYLEEFDVKFKKAWKETVVACKESQVDDGMRPWGHSDLEYQSGNKPFSCDKDDKSPECQKSWNDFWEECYYPEEYESHDPDDYKNCPVPPWMQSDSESYYPEPNQKQYTEEELDAMCDAAVKQEEKDKCREYNLREAEYYNQRAKLDAEVEAIKAAGGYEWTPDPQISRNDGTRLKYEDGWVYESPDGGKTVTKRRVGSTEKIVVQEDKPKKWVLPVQQGTIDGVNDYYVEFPDDLLDAAGLREGDSVEWVDRKDGSFQLRKVNSPMYHPV